MKIVKFRIKNYRSIRDTGDCYLDGKITILAGKNEAGKTTILEALEDFNTDKDVREDAIPLWDESSKPEIELTTKLEKEDVSQIFEKFGIKKSNVDELTIKVSKVYPRDYKIDYSEILKALFPEKKKLEKDLVELIKDLEKKIENLPVDENYVKNQLYNTPEVNAFDNLKFIDGLSKGEIKKLNEKIKKLKERVKEFNEIKKFVREFEEFFKSNFFPNFILFKTFEDVLPSQIPISQVPQNELVKDLAKISGLDSTLIQPTIDPRKRIKHKEEINLKLQEDYKEFWSQDNSKIKVEWGDTDIYFFIEEDRELYKPEIRSKGKQWHLAFYIRVTARSVEGGNNVLLIDDPGLFLHAKAQKDILKKLEKCAQCLQIIYATHSPYLMPSDKLSRVRLIIKYDREGTKIEKVTAKADKETLTPILTAIGEDLSVGIRVDKKNSVVVEGYSDYLYLTTFKNLLNIQTELNFVPSVGADNVVHVGAVLFGWGLDPIFVLDNDDKGNRIKGKLEEKLSIDKERTILIPENEEGSIEDLFSKEDFLKYIESNIQTHSKVLTATRFYQEVENGKIKISDITDETKQNFKYLFERLNELVKNENSN